MSADRRLVFHMGIPKTGSSALQVAFVRNRELLADLGIHYPAIRSDAVALEGGVVSGNGQLLVPFLSPRPNHEEPVMARARSRFLDEIDGAPVSDVLYSSEGLFSFRRDRLDELVRETTDRGFSVHAVLFIRDWVGHALSAYSQHVKESLLTATFSEYLDSGFDGILPYAPRFDVRCAALIEILGREQVHVIHYDSVRERLFEEFMQTAFGMSDASGFDLSAGQVNRSLTRTEIDMMRYMNRSLRGRFNARLVSGALIRRPPLGAQGLTISPTELEILRQRCGDQSAWVNETFFGGDNRLRVESDRVTVAEDIGLATERSEVEGYMLDWLVEMANRQGPQDEGSPEGPPQAPITGRTPSGARSHEAEVPSPTQPPIRREPMTDQDNAHDERAKRVGRAARKLAENEGHEWKTLPVEQRREFRTRARKDEQRQQGKAC